MSNLEILGLIWGFTFFVIVVALLYVVNEEARENANKKAERDARFAKLRNERSGGYGHRR